MTPRRTRGYLLSDWGDTLMRVFPDLPGRMKDWPRVEALPSAAETLAALHPAWTLALATNAANSDEADIRFALRRAGLVERDGTSALPAGDRALQERRRGIPAEDG